MYRDNSVVKYLIIAYIAFFFMLVIGIYCVCIGLFPIELKIEHINGKSVAQIHRKSRLSPFKDIYVTVPDLKIATIATLKPSSSRDLPTYRVELESYDGKKTPLTPDYSSEYTENKEIQDKINEKIKSKTEFIYIKKQYGILLFGLMFCFTALLGMFVHLKQIKLLKKPKKVFYQSESKKYKNINDSIIK